MQIGTSLRRVLGYAALVFVLLGASCVPKFAMAPTPEPVKLRFAYRQNTVQVEELLKQFQSKYPWITVEVVEAERFGDNLQTLLDNGDIDVFRESRSALSYAQAEILRPVDELVGDKWAAIQDDYYKGTWEALALDGRQWGIPAGLDMLVTYINLDQLKALKLEAPPLDWTQFDFVDLANQMNFPEGAPYADSIKLFGFCTSLDGRTLDPIVFIYLHGGKIVDDINSPTRATLDDPLTIEAVKWYTDLFTRYGVAPDPQLVEQSYRRFGILEAEVRGNCSLWTGWYSNRGGLDTPFQWSTAWIMRPLPRDTMDWNLGDVDGYFVTKDCAHPTEAITLIRFLSDYWEAAGQKLPPRKSLVEKEAYKQAVGEETAEIARTFGQREVLMVPINAHPDLEKVGGVLFEALNQIIREGLDPADVLPAAQDRCQGFFQTQ